MQQKPPDRKHSVSKTSNNWKKEHFDDQYVKQSWQDGYRSRASYKLIELDEKDKLLRPGMTGTILASRNILRRASAS